MLGNHLNFYLISIIKICWTLHYVKPLFVFCNLLSLYSLINTDSVYWLKEDIFPKVIQEHFLACYNHHLFLLRKVNIVYGILRYGLLLYFYLSHENRKSKCQNRFYTSWSFPIWPSGHRSLCCHCNPVFCRSDGEYHTDSSHSTGHQTPHSNVLPTQSTLFHWHDVHLYHCAQNGNQLSVQ